MAELFASGQIVDAILVLVGLEALLLLALRARRGGGPAPASLLANLASGAALMLSLRAALTGAAWPVVAGWLTVSLFAHLAEMTLRFRRAAEHPRAAVIVPAGTTVDE
ncbi:hypothetical protein [Methylobacterium sp. B4]|uniref:hypothetical protein n=1 Tax=Methylobacterium sp. B4 TaxID=1938755 RepID=UPI000D7553E5|nr:hypothetical protein [Methylobacterium sp. B4]PXW55031.1 hypothetical protein BY998_11941 [Methylobacterium sp. B4]